MKFGKEKCAMLIMKSRKRQIADRIKQPNQERPEPVEKKNHKYLEILEAATIK